jgi:hypothetical protein
MNQILGVTINSPIPSVPKPGQCFDKNTQLLMNDGTFKSIESVEIGDILTNNNIITAKLKLDAKDNEMFQLGNVIVSGSHQSIYKSKWIFVKDHPERKLVLNYSEPYIYCLNTSLKTINIDDMIYCDWDEIFDEEKYELLSHLELPDLSGEYIHKYYDGGFYFDAKVNLQNGRLREISSIKIGDILKNGEKVVGLVEVFGENLGQNKIKRKSCGINVIPIIPNNISDNSENESLEEYNYLLKKRKLYHLLTDKNYFSVENIKYFHYNSCVELFLKKYRGKLLSMKYV